MHLAAATTPKPGASVTIAFPPTRSAVLSWNAPTANVGRIDLRVRFTDGSWSTWLGYAERSVRISRSLSETARGVRIDVDRILADTPFDAVEVSAKRSAAWFAVAVPPADERARGEASVPAIDLDVPRRSQYVEAFPYERGWCSPAALAMLLAHRGIDKPVADVARGVFDQRYNGAGNWAFNVAYAGTFGLAAAVMMLDGFADAARFLAAGVPLAVSYAWAPGELPGAPVEHTTGHLGVLRGFDAAGKVLLNDPAQPEIAAVYDGPAFARAWARRDFTAYALDTDRDRLLALANA